MRIRVEIAGDEELIDAVVAEAFGQVDEACLVRELRVDGSFDSRLSLVAEVGDGVVGHVLFSFAAVVDGDHERPVLALAPLSVRSAYQGRGVGSALVLAGIHQARAMGHSMVLVVGEPGYYRRFGFVPAAAFGVLAPFPVPDEAFMMLCLDDGARTDVRGVMRYARAFDALTQPDSDQTG